MERLRQLKKIWLKRPLLSRVWILFAFLLVVSVELHHFLKDSSSGQVRKLAARRDLKPGIILSLHDLTVGIDAETRGDGGLTFSDQEIDDVLGAQVTAEIPAGALILRTQIRQKDSVKFSRRVPKGYRAFLIRTQSRLPLEIGDRVDLVRKRTERGEEKRIFFEDKKILAFNKRDTYQEILVALTLEDITQMENCLEDEWVEVILRNPQDESKAERKKESAKVRKARSIELLEEG
ncbi:MAG: hypothetical protein EBQ92_08810 [Proteobacteria bacterium]|nr:hypothetical protein [Pseudomonadota bacterium]